MSVMDNNACINGQKWEAYVKHMMSNYTGLPIIQCSKKNRLFDYKVDAVYSNVPYASMYDIDDEISGCRFDCVLVLFGKGIWVECKSQSSNGSVDQKYPYMFTSMEKQPRLDYGIFAFDCLGASSKALVWLEKACGDSPKQLKIMDKEQLDTFLCPCVQTQSIVW